MDADPGMRMGYVLCVFKYSLSMHYDERDVESRIRRQLRMRELHIFIVTIKPFPCQKGEARDKISLRSVHSEREPSAQKGI